jgi:regulatory protein
VLFVMTVIEISSAAVRFAAMNLLAMREHSEDELYKKLTQKFDQFDLVVDVITALKNDGLQSDLRFAEAFITMRKRQGKGQKLIAMELKERGVANELIVELVRADDESWDKLALAVKQKKFKMTVPIDLKEKTKQMRFLTSRGFSSASIQYALKFEATGYI